MKYRPKIGVGDFDTKTRQVTKFLTEGHKVKITIMFRGREMSHPELGKKLLDQVAVQVGSIAKIEAAPKLDGRNMIMVLAPDRRGAGGAAAGQASAGPAGPAAPAAPRRSGVRVPERSAPPAPAVTAPTSPAVSSAPPTPPPPPPNGRAQTNHTAAPAPAGAPSGTEES